ncbi:LPS assembly lipoprotein LptE [Mesorhizobium sp. SP-1A]|uniref:LPS assembly lipoprotein LptE n=1 Tax=Mesorhizobium sp. SP-1A TaxID=3077840 RepID=UPI0028F74199|nr:LPS assembly lipoprotein LptE [Mesorhizobium sp. SP-1A]
MSLPEKSGAGARRFLRASVLCGLVAAATVVAGCQVRPLYSNAPLSPNAQLPAQAELASIAVKPVNTRYAQQVRNNLIFGLNGGAERTAAPAYSLDLGVTELVQSVAVVQVASNEDQPTAGTVTLTANYTLTDAKTSAVVGRGKRAISASFDRPTQQFATYRAQIDAENRAARELAELLRLSLAEDLARKR